MIDYTLPRSFSQRHVLGGQYGGKWLQLSLHQSSSTPETPRKIQFELDLQLFKSHTVSANIPE